MTTPSRTTDRPGSPHYQAIPALPCGCHKDGTGFCPGGRLLSAAWLTSADPTDRTSAEWLALAAHLEVPTPIYPARKGDPAPPTIPVTQEPVPRPLASGAIATYVQYALWEHQAGQRQGAPSLAFRVTATEEDAERLEWALGNVLPVGVMVTRTRLACGAWNILVADERNS